MSAIFDKWERLVRTKLKKEDFREPVCVPLLSSTSSSSSSTSSSYDQFPPDSVVPQDKSESQSTNDPEKEATIPKAPAPNLAAQTFSFSELAAARKNFRPNYKSESQSTNDHEKEATIPKAPAPNIAAQTFSFSELAAATKNFRPECLLGEDGYGIFFKGRLQSTGMVVAVKQVYQSSLERNKDFLVKVETLSRLHHPNLVNLLGYCADGAKQLLVYKYFPLGSLEDHLHDLLADQEPLDWNTRMKIAAGVAKGLEYLHDKANPPLVHGDLKPSNILLDEGYLPKLSNSQLEILRPISDARCFQRGNYSPPEGPIFSKSNVYSLGVVLLELITGCKAIDSTRPPGRQNLVAWARPLFMEKRKFPKMVDPLLQGHYPLRELYQALAVANMCLKVEATSRPPIRDVVTAMTYLASQIYDLNAPASLSKTAGPDRMTNKNSLDSKS